jgi:hypothetical protein
MRVAAERGVSGPGRCSPCPWAALFLAHASPHAVVLSGVQREGQALPPDGQPAQIAFAWVTWCTEGPDEETGKNSSGSASRRAASCRQSRSGIVILWSPGGRGGVVICGRDR